MRETKARGEENRSKGKNKDKGEEGVSEEAKHEASTGRAGLGSNTTKRKRRSKQ